MGGRRAVPLPAWLDLDRLASVDPRPGWENNGACVSEQLEVFYPERGDSTDAAKGVCARCPAVYACLASVLANSANGHDWGVWGRTSVEERRTVRKALALRQENAA